jgi:hypothetical protein
VLKKIVTELAQKAPILYKKSCKMLKMLGATKIEAPLHSEKISD